MANLSDLTSGRGGTQGRPVPLAAPAPWTPGLWLASVAALLAVTAAISGQSFWIDEVNTAWRLTEPRFAVFLTNMTAEAGSDAQMPLFLAVMWGWAKLFGLDEWTLRAINFVWILPGLWVFANGRAERLVVAATSAFLWYYLDEARPYGMQIGASLLAFGLLERLLANAATARAALLRPGEAWLLALALVVLAGSTMLGAIWAGAAVLGAALALPPRRWRQGGRGLALPAAAALALCLPLGGYYLWTVLGGAGGSRVGTTSLLTVGFTAYELLGFAGLGPGRGDLRDAGAAALSPATLAPLLALALCTAAVLAAGTARAIRTVPRRILLAFGAALLLATATILIAGALMHWRAVGRHFAPLLAPILAVQAAGIAALWQHRAGRAVAVAFLALSLASAASIRLAPRHAKDDYRTAAAIAAEALARGETVWWNADAFGAMVYGVPLGEGCGQALIVNEPPAGFGTRHPAPALVIASKPDIYDSRGTLKTYLAAGAYTPTADPMAFTIWQAPPGTTPAAPSCR